MASKRTCFRCGHKNEPARLFCEVCDDDLREQAAEMARIAAQDKTADLHDGHVGMWLEADGEPFHVLGDPNMNEETLEALREMARAARRMMEEKAHEDETPD